MAVLACVLWAVAVRAPSPVAAGTQTCLVPDGEQYVRTACDDPSAVAQVVAVTARAAPGRLPDCPLDIDFWVTGPAEGTLCARNLDPPHPGRPGGGGGLLLVGDCVDDGGGATGEVPCDGPAAIARVVALARTSGACPLTSTTYLQLRGTTPTPVACLQPR